MNRTLSLDEILGIVDEDSNPTRGYPPPKQSGPLRWFDKEMRCLNDGEFSGRRVVCHAPTYCKVNGIPKCTTHAMKELNQMLIERGME